MDSLVDDLPHGELPPVIAQRGQHALEGGVHAVQVLLGGLLGVKRGHEIQLTVPPLAVAVQRRDGIVALRTAAHVGCVIRELQRLA